MLDQQLQKRWIAWSREGYPKEKKGILLKKYKVVEHFKAPILNEEIALKLSDNGRNRDKYFTIIQDLSGTALTALGSVASSLLSTQDGEMDVIEALNRLCDVGRLLSIINFNTSKSRKAFLEPGLSKETKQVLELTQIGKYLYGESLSEKIKKSQAVVKLADSMKMKEDNQKSFPQKNFQQNLNYKSPLGKRPFPQQKGFYNVPFNRRFNPQNRNKSFYNQKGVNNGQKAKANQQTNKKQ